MIEVLQLLHGLDGDTTRNCGSYYVRHLEKYEPVPSDTGYPDGPLNQKDWIWVARSSSTHEALGTLIAAPVQGLALILRIYASNGKVLPGLLRKSLEDMLQRGYTRYMVMFSSSREEEVKLLRIVKRAGGDKVSDCTVWAGPTAIRW